MALYVRLVDHVYAIFVAEIIPDRVVGIMRRAHCVEVELLHEFDIFHHGFGGDSVAPYIFMFVSVDAFQEHRNSVDNYLPILYLYLAESDFAALDLCYGALVILECDQ